MNSKDLVDIMQYICDLDNKKISIVNADVNQDGEVDDVDSVILNKYLSNWVDKLPYKSGEKYKITYNCVEDDVYRARTYAQISLPIRLEEPVREGYEFLGWTGSNGNTPQKEVRIGRNTTGDLTYTANWKQISN